MNCKGQLIQVWCRHYCDFHAWDDEKHAQTPEDVGTGSELPREWFRRRGYVCVGKVDGYDQCFTQWTLLGHKCKYIKNLMAQ